MFVLFGSFLLLILASMQMGAVRMVFADFPSVHQGDLVLSGNDVFIIDGRFDINGSIVVEGNATLFLRNSELIFMLTENGQFNMSLRNPENGNPRLIIENTSISSGSSFYVDLYLYSNSSAQVDELLTSLFVDVIMYQGSSLTLTDSAANYFVTYQDSKLVASNSTVNSVSGLDNSQILAVNTTIGVLSAEDNAHVSLSNCTVSAQIGTVDVNCSIIELKPGLTDSWNMFTNCSVTGNVFPNVTFTDTQVNSWGFFFWGNSNVSIIRSDIEFVRLLNSSSSTIHEARMFWIYSYNSSTIIAYDSSLNWAFSYDNSKIWLVNTTMVLPTTSNQSHVYFSWYLDVHVVDVIGQDVPNATVTATFPNYTLAETERTKSDGWARLTLTEKTWDSTGKHPVGNYSIEAMYETHVKNITVNLKESQKLTLTLDFTVPELPSFLTLALFMIITLIAVTVHRHKRGTRSRVEAKKSLARGLGRMVHGRRNCSPGNNYAY